MADLNNKFSFDFEMVNLDSFNVAYQQKLNNDIDVTRGIFHKRYVVTSRNKDTKIKYLVDKLGSSDELLKLKMQNHNEVLADWVLAKKEIKQNNMIIYVFILIEF